MSEQATLKSPMKPGMRVRNPALGRYKTDEFTFVKETVDTITYKRKTVSADGKKVTVQTFTEPKWGRLLPDGNVEIMWGKMRIVLKQ